VGRPRATIRAMRHGALAQVLRPWALWSVGVFGVVSGAHADAAPSPGAAEDLAERTIAHTLAVVESELDAARTARARLDEHAAFSALARAEDALGEAFTATAAHAWLAEIAVQRGLTAAQAGLTGLADSAFERAASLDAERVVGLAEAPPRTVALARAARERVLARPLLPWGVSITPPAAGLRVDGQILPSNGPPALRGGPHLVVLSAQGHEPQAALVDLADGPRALGRFALLPTPEGAPMRAPETTPTEPLALDAAPISAPSSPRAPRRARRWMGWASGALAVAGAAATALVLGLRSAPPGTRTLVVDPGPSAP
jgi:hypothetical protein